MSVIDLESRRADREARAEIFWEYIERRGDVYDLLESGLQKLQASSIPRSIIADELRLQVELFASGRR